MRSIFLLVPHTSYLKPHARLRKLRDFLQDSIALETAQVIDEERAVEMIDLVAHRPGHQSVAPHLALLSVAIEIAQLHPLRAGDDLDKVGNRETAFFLG